MPQRIPDIAIVRWAPTRAAALLLVLAAVCASGAARAAEPVNNGKANAAKPAAKPAKPADPVMTRAELRDCMAKQDHNRGLTSELEAERDKLSADKAELQRQGDELKAQLPSVDRTSAEAVAKYNEQAGARDAAVEALSTRTDAFNTRVQAAQAERADYVAKCENRRFDERDQAAIRNGK